MHCDCDATGSLFCHVAEIIAARAEWQVKLSKKSPTGRFHMILGECERERLRGGNRDRFECTAWYLFVHQSLRYRASYLPYTLSVCLCLCLRVWTHRALLSLSLSLLFSLLILVLTLP